MPTSTMFQTLPEQWIPAAFSRDLRRSPHAVHVADEALVLFRDRDGRAHALVDRCPHRGVALSRGRVTEDGCLQCPFHGWEFSGDGSCERVPLNPDARRELLSATAVPAIERGGLVWVYTSVDAEAPGEPQLPAMLTEAGLVTRYLEATWSCHWTRAMENMLDAPHLPFVHKRTIGRGMPTRAGDRELAMTFDIERRPTGMRVRWMIDGARLEPEAWLEWWRPTGMALNIPTPFGRNRIHVFCVPGRKGQTRMMLAAVSELPWYLKLLPRRPMDWINLLILGEDQRVLESAGPEEAPPPGVERSVETDRPTLIFRRWYWEQRRAREAKTRAA